MGRTKVGSLPTYQHHRASGQAVVAIRGRDIYLGVYGSNESKAEYARVIVELVSTGTVTAPDNQTEDEPVSVMEILAAYWAFAQGYYVKSGKPTDEQKAVKKVLRDVKALCGGLPAIEVGPRVLKAIRQVWISQGLCRGYINQNTGRVRRIFKWAVSEEMVSPSIMEGLRAVSGLRKGRSLARESVPVPPVAIDVVERTMPHLSSVVADMVRLQLLTGARPGEVCKLRPSDVDRGRDVWEYHVDGHNMEHHGRSRVVYLGPDAQAILSPYLLREPNQRCFSPTESIADLRARRSGNRKTPMGYGNGPGRKRDDGGLRGEAARWKPRDAYSTGSYGQAIKRACDIAFPPPDPLAKRSDETLEQYKTRLTAVQLAELSKWQRSQRWAPNQLRHTRATEIRQKFGLEAAQTVLGHAAANITEIYAERDADKARRYYQKRVCSLSSIITKQCFRKNIDGHRLNDEAGQHQKGFFFFAAVTVVAFAAFFGVNRFHVYLQRHTTQSFVVAELHDGFPQVSAITIFDRFNRPKIVLLHKCNKPPLVNPFRWVDLVRIDLDDSRLECIVDGTPIEIERGIQIRYAIDDAKPMVLRMADTKHLPHSPDAKWDALVSSRLPH